MACGARGNHRHVAVLGPYETKDRPRWMTREGWCGLFRNGGPRGRGLGRLGWHAQPVVGRQLSVSTLKAAQEEVRGPGGHSRILSLRTRTIWFIDGAQALPGNRPKSAALVWFYASGGHLHALIISMGLTHWDGQVPRRGVKCSLRGHTPVLVQGKGVW